MGKLKPITYIRIVDMPSGFSFIIKRKKGYPTAFALFSKNSSQFDTVAIKDGLFLALVSTWFDDVTVL